MVESMDRMAPTPLEQDVARWTHLRVTLAVARGNRSGCERRYGGVRCVDGRGGTVSEILKAVRWTVSQCIGHRPLVPTPPRLSLHS